MLRRKICSGQVIHEVAAAHLLPSVFHYVYDLSYTVHRKCRSPFSPSSQSRPLAQNSHSNQSYGHGPESSKHFVWLGISQGSINEVG